jgi:hypothetical protein
VDQASADMQTETQEPQHQKNNENGPKPVNLLIGPGLIRFADSGAPIQDGAVTILPMTSGEWSCSRAHVLRYFLQLSLTMAKSVTVI